MGIFYSSVVYLFHHQNKMINDIETSSFHDTCLIADEDNQSDNDLPDLISIDELKVNDINSDTQNDTQNNTQSDIRSDIRSDSNNDNILFYNKLSPNNITGKECFNLVETTFTTIPLYGIPLNTIHTTEYIPKYMTYFGRNFSCYGKDKNIPCPKNIYCSTERPIIFMIHNGNPSNINHLFMEKNHTQKFTIMQFHQCNCHPKIELTYIDGKVVNTRLMSNDDFYLKK
jgi:hypothetical protein